MAITTTLYQRFKKQKIGGKNYPWFKSYKKSSNCDETDCATKRTSSIIYCTKTNESEMKRKFSQIREVSDYEFKSNMQDRRRSSDMYLVPIGTASYDSTYRSRTVETDFIYLPKRIIDITTLPEDDIAGKTVSFFWWFCFITARMLAISSFAYFYPKEILWILGFHFILIVAFLIYDADAAEVRRRKAVFFIFVGLVYLFCIIEFKIKFKKAKFWYYGYFTIVYLQNFIMSLVWWFSKLHILEEDWWFHYIFYLIIVFCVLSLTSMVYYFSISKPKSVSVDRVVVND